MASVMRTLTLPMMSRLPLLQLGHLVTSEILTTKHQMELLVTSVGDLLVAQLLLQAGLKLGV
jgi:hypothetical protein